MTATTKAKRQNDPHVAAIRTVKRLAAKARAATDELDEFMARVPEPQRAYLRSIAGLPDLIDHGEADDEDGEE